MRRSTALVALALGALAGGAAADELSDDLKSRRARLMDRLGPEALLIHRSAPPRTYSRDVDYEYRQDSDLYYLTGMDQPQTALVLMPGNRKRREILFIAERDARSEHWQGRRLSSEEAAARSGIETVYLTSQFEPLLNMILAGRPFRLPPDFARTDDFDVFLGHLARRQARVALLLEPKPGLSGALGPAFEFARTLRERFFGFEVQDARDLLRDLREVKTPYERKLLEKSLAISSEAQVAGMRAAVPGAYEHAVKAAIEAVYRTRGALGPGYPSIVGSGPNATILHYPAADRRMEAGDLLLVDAAANYQYMTGDITRTYPVSGAFGPAQRDLYELVYRAQEEAITVARPGASLEDVHLKTVEVVKDGLLRLGLITDVKGQQYHTWYTHSGTHFIGLDVHDVGDRDRPLQPGVAFVIEPGIYVREGALEALPDTPENRAFKEKVRPAYEKYKGIGVRIEDSFLLTESGLVNLSASVPRAPAQVEAFLKARPRAAGER